MMMVRCVKNRRVKVSLVFTAVLAGFVIASGPGFAAPQAPVCRQSEAALVVSRERADDPGQDIAVRRLSGPVPKSPCLYAPKPDDWILGQNEADYVLALRGRFLVLDSGTGPDRVLRIFDVSSRLTLFEGRYDDTKGKLAVSDTEVLFWQVSVTPGKTSSCPAAWRQVKENRMAKQAHETMQVRFAFADATAHKMGLKSCVLTQDDVE